MAAADKPAKGELAKNELIFVDYNIAKGLHDVAAEQVCTWRNHAVFCAREGCRDWRGNIGDEGRGGLLRVLTAGCIRRQAPTSAGVCKSPSGSPSARTTREQLKSFTAFNR